MSKSSVTVEITPTFLNVGLFIGSVLGWILNIYQIVVNDYSLGYLALKLIGIIFVPVGTVLGYVGL